MNAPHTLPVRPVPLQAGAEVPVPRQVADYIAGMTDRFASREHTRLTGQQLLA
jgi:dGTPase